MNTIGIQYIEEVEFHTITIDGEMICPKFYKLHPKEEILEGPGHLATTMSPYFAERERSAVWKKLLYEGEDKLIVPILVCSDDLDLSCIVIYAEIRKEKDRVLWLRIGTRLEYDTVRWLSKIPPFEFSKQEYNNVLLQFRDWVEIDTIEKSILNWIRMIGRLNLVPNSITEVTFFLQETQIDEYRLSIMSYVLNEENGKMSTPISLDIESLLIEDLQFQRPSKPIQYIVKDGIVRYYQRYGNLNFIHFAKSIFFKFNNDAIALIEKPQASYALEHFYSRKLKDKLKTWVQELESNTPNIKFDGKSFEIERLDKEIKVFLQQFNSSILLSHKDNLQPILQYINTKYNPTNFYKIVEEIMKRSIGRGGRRRK